MPRHIDDADDLEEREEQQRQKREALRAALAEGEQSGIAEDSTLEGVLSEFRSRRAR